MTARQVTGWLLAVSGTLLLSACVTVPPEDAAQNGAGEGRPAWVTQPPRTGDVIYGSGGSPVGDDASAASTRARQAATADLMTGLRVRIMAETRSEVTETDGDVSQFYAQSVTSRVDEIALDDVRLEDTWESSQQYLYALVSLDTAQAARQLKNAYAQERGLLDATPGQRTETDALWNQLSQWQRFISLAATQQSRDELHRLFVGESIDPQWSADYMTMQQQYADFVASISVALQAEDELTAQWATTLSQPWTDLGIPLSVDGSDTDWSLHLATRTEDRSDAQARRHEVTVDATLRDENQQVRWQHSASARGVAGGDERAFRQAITGAADQLAVAWRDRVRAID